MAFLLRVVNKAKWIPAEWMSRDDIPADALNDLRTTNNELSVWSVESDHRNLNIALTALASRRQQLDKLDYTLIDEEILLPIPIKCRKSEGDTPYISANGSIHRDLIELTVNKVALLADQMMPLERVRVPEKQVKELLVEALRSGVIDRNHIDSKLLSQLEAGRPAPPLLEH